MDDDIRTLRIGVPFMEEILDGIAHDFEDIEPYERFKILDFGFDKDEQEIVWNVQVIRETMN